MVMHQPHWLVTPAFNSATWMSKYSCCDTLTDTGLHTVSISDTVHV